MTKNDLKKLHELQAKNKQLEKWVNDLQAGMYINCVYCGHCYGPDDEVPASMADILKEHIEKCPEHPMSKLKIKNKKFQEALKKMQEFLGCFGQIDGLKYMIEQALKLKS